jgi:hypothetical protein
LITRRATRTPAPSGALPESPVVQPVEQAMMYKGHQIEAGSYCVRSVAWSPRAIVSVMSAEGAWQRTPLYSTSSARFPTQHEADRCAIDIARAWIDATLERHRPPPM